MAKEKEKEKPQRCGDCKNCNTVNYGRGIPVCYMIHTDPSGQPQEKRITLKSRQAKYCRYFATKAEVGA